MSTEQRVSSVVSLAGDKSDSSISSIRIGMIGLGTVGTGVYRVLHSRAGLSFSGIAVKNPQKNRGLESLDVSLLTDDPYKIVNDPAVDIVVEVMGGIDPAQGLIIQALKNGKHVVTANKELIAKHGGELFQLAQEHQVRLLYEGAVAGGIPIIMPLKLSLAGNRIEEIAGILNGTTNYILTKMTQEGWDFEQALKVAQEKGFAEADPTSDVDGFDAAYKIAILASLAFQQQVEVSQVFREGITRISHLDIQNAEALGFTIKLLGLARRGENNQLDIRVHPMLVPQAHPLAGIHNEYNAVWVKGDAVGEVMFSGRGAGELPTASAVTGDILAIAHDLSLGNTPIPAMAVTYHGQAQVTPVIENVNRYYIRLDATDHPGVMGNLGQACGEHGVSLEMVVQKGTNADGTASIVLVTHEVPEKKMQQALDQIAQQPTTKQVGCMLRVW